MLVLALAFASLLLWPALGQAATFTVNSTVDVPDFATGNGICDALLSAFPSPVYACTLRAAIQEANATPAHDTIVVPAGNYQITRLGPTEDAAFSGDLDITSSLTIIGNRVGDPAGCGAGSTNTCISGQGSGGRVFDLIGLAPGMTVRMERVRIRGGESGPGAGIYLHSGGFTPTLNLIDVWVQANRALGIWGGGIYNADGNMNIHSTGITDDTRSYLADNVAKYGGGIASAGGSVNITGSTYVLQNTATATGSSGGGVAVWGGQTMFGSDSYLGYNSAPQGSGGGLHVSGSAVVALQNAYVWGGHAGEYGGGVYVSGGGTLQIAGGSSIRYGQAIAGGGLFLSNGSVQISGGFHVSDNQATDGAGIYAGLGGSLTVTNSTISGNAAANAGGGIFSYTHNGVSVRDSTISGNSAGSDGGGIYGAAGEITATNSTISGNSAGSEGGGIFNAVQGTLIMTSVTVSANSAGGIHNHGAVTLLNSINANQVTGIDCAGDSRVLPAGYNLDSDATCQLVGTGDISGGFADLLPLTPNAAGTATHGLGTNSAARDVIPVGTNGCGTTLTTDQRGATRPRGARCDIGAFEAGPLPAANAGSDQAVDEGATVMLDASASTGEGLTYLWEQLPGAPTVSLVNPASRQPTFTAPLLAGGIGGPLTLTFRLTIDDGALSATDEVTVTVSQVNQAPAANAGLDQAHDEGGVVALDGTHSDDPDGDPLVTFSWTQISGPPVALDDAGSATPHFMAPAVGPGGLTLVFRLTVSDGVLSSDPDGVLSDVTITIRDVNAAPSCAAAYIKPALLPQTNHQFVPVAILGVSDPDGDPVTISVTGVTQDEPVNGDRDGNTSPDAVIDQGAVMIRAERQNSGNGRVYQISFTAADGGGGTCSGVVTVGVPSSKKNGTAVDDGQLYDSTRP